MMKIALCNKKGYAVKDLIDAYQHTLEALEKRREELCGRRGECDRRITLIDFEIEEICEVLRTLTKYNYDEGSTGQV